MGYLFLMIALLAGTIKGYCGKKTGGLIAATKDALLANLIRMGLCILIGFAVVFFGGNTAELIPSVPLLAIGALSGIFTALFVVMAICLFLNSYFKTLAAEYLDTVLLYPLNQGLALVLSTVMATALFREKLTTKAIFGILTAFAGLIIINLI